MRYGFFLCALGGEALNSGIAWGKYLLPANNDGGSGSAHPGERRGHASVFERGSCHGRSGKDPLPGRHTPAVRSKPSVRSIAEWASLRPDRPSDALDLKQEQSQSTPLAESRLWSYRFLELLGQASLPRTITLRIDVSS